MESEAGNMSFYIFLVCLLLLLIASVVSNSVRPHRRQPTGLPRPWDSPGKNTGVGCHFLLQCMKVESENWKGSCLVVSDSSRPHTAGYQAPLSMGFSRQEDWSGVPSPSLKYYAISQKLSFPHSSFGKESTCNAGDSSLIPGSGRSPGEGIGYPLQDPWASPVAQLVKNPPAMWEIWVQSLGWEDPLEKGRATHSTILAWRIPWTV